MHIADGVLSATTTGNLILVGSTVAAAAATAIGLRTIDEQRIPRVAVLSAAFFVMSFVSLPLGPASTHFIFTGLLGVMLGWAAVPAILIGLSVQYLFFGLGGITTLGINTLTMALPAVLCYYMFRRPVQLHHPQLVWLSGFSAGLFGVLLAVLLHGLVLAAVGRGFLAAASVSCLADIAIAPIEGLITGSIVLFLRRVRSEMFDVDALVSSVTS